MQAIIMMSDRYWCYRHVQACSQSAGCSEAQQHALFDTWYGMHNTELCRSRPARLPACLLLLLQVTAAHWITQVR